MKVAFFLILMQHNVDKRNTTKFEREVQKSKKNLVV